MARAKQASKRNAPRIALPVWGAAGMSLAMAGGASAAVAPTTDGAAQRTAPPPVFTLGEEELSDVSPVQILRLRSGSHRPSRSASSMPKGAAAAAGAAAAVAAAAARPMRRRRMCRGPMRRRPMRRRMRRGPMPVACVDAPWSAAAAAAVWDWWDAPAAAAAAACRGDPASSARLRACFQLR